jgi:hypothetical protein
MTPLHREGVSWTPALLQSVGTTAVYAAAGSDNPSNSSMTAPKADQIRRHGDAIER